MLRLIEKDIRFNWKWALLMVLIAVAMPLVLYMDREETRVTLFVYIIGGVLANSHLVSKACYQDDGAQTRRFLASLPVRRAWLVLSKYLLGLLCLAVTITLTSTLSLALGLRPSVQGALIAAVYLLLYYAVFLGVYFRTDYSGAEKANATFMMLTVASAFVIDRSGGRLDEMVINPLAMLTGVGLCGLIFAMSMILSLQAVGSRD